MTELFLGIIAVSVLAMAVIQVAAAVVTARMVRQMGETVARLEHDLRPIVSNLQTLSADSARAAALASVQMERADRLFADVAARVDASFLTLQRSLLRPAREGMAVLHGIMAALAALREWRGPAAPADAEEEESLFIG